VLLGISSWKLSLYTTVNNFIKNDKGTKNVSKAYLKIFFKAEIAELKSDKEYKKYIDKNVGIWSACVGISIISSAVCLALILKAQRKSKK
jgi:hypothetical protein